MEKKRRGLGRRGGDEKEKEKTNKVDLNGEEGLAFSVRGNGAIDPGGEEVLEAAHVLDDHGGGKSGAVDVLGLETGSR